MGLTEFPRIKEIRTFIIDGVGSGGDYHNVSNISFEYGHILEPEKLILMLFSGQGWPLADRQQHLYSHDQVGAVPWLAYFLGY